MITRQLPDLRSVLTFLRDAGPYVLLELVMPGGTLVALALFYFRQPARRAGLRRYARRLRRWFEYCGQRLAQFDLYAVACACPARQLATAAIKRFH